MSEPNSTTTANEATTPDHSPEATTEKTFTQAEVDSMIGHRLAAERKEMPGKEELEAFRAWKESQQTEKERRDVLTRERDESRTALTAAQAELEQYRREKLLLSKGVPADDVDYYAFKIGKLVTDTIDFEKAAEQYIKDHAPQEPEKPATVRVDMAGPLSGGSAAKTANEQMNSLIRGARK